MDQATSNQVWDTLSKGISDYFSYATARVKTQAAPSGSVIYTNAANPFPGTQGAYPQAEAKPSPGGASSASIANALGGGVGLLVVALIIIALLFKR